jgi:3'-phosphoadenosine 5'-phosphosulfate sulfotransferase (PAPS reductase)/FAD synthetase
MANVNVDELRQLLTLDLNAKIQKTVAKITEFYNAMEGKVYISFSGGKDSQILLHIARQLLPNIPAVFCNTGNENPSIVKHVKTFDNVEIIRPKKTIKEVIIEKGYPVISKEFSQNFAVSQRTPNGKTMLRKFISEEKKDRWSYRQWKFLFEANIPISHSCCEYLKKKPFKEYEEKNKVSPILGILAMESSLRKRQWFTTGCNIFNDRRNTSKPLSFWTEQDILEYIRRTGIKIADCYGDIIETKKGLKLTGEQRTGCMLCLFGSKNILQKRLKRLRETYPKMYNQALSGGEEINGLWRPNAEGFGYRHVLDTIYKGEFKYE